ncbi:hypothetical protein CK203_048030 [Vitis vinifera]|uniref:Uncharacterized protein n=1 Tax=Vitis vinifera TaxID=29760 RepID=A0A438GYZ8_VITVI|nr:hypothetical protein CK203_048030 [Vitis vinifera]
MTTHRVRILLSSTSLLMNVMGDIHMLVSFEKELPPSIEGPQEEATESRCHSTAIPELLCQILEAFGYPSEPQLERRRISQEIFTLDKWTSMTAYLHSQEPQLDQRLMPEATSYAPPTTPETPPVVPATSVPHPSESSISISISEFRGLCHTLQTLTTTQSVLAQSISRRSSSRANCCPHEEMTTGDIETPILSTQTSTTKSSSPHDPPTTT